MIDDDDFKLKKNKKEKETKQRLYSEWVSHLNLHNKAQQFVLRDFINQSKL